MNRDQTRKKNVRDNSKWQRQREYAEALRLSDEALLKRALEIVDNQSKHNLK